MTSIQLKKMGFWFGMVLIILGLFYFMLVATVIFSGSGFPPTEPLQSVINILIIITAVWMVFFWGILNQAMLIEGKIFSNISFALIVIFAGLTSINRYVGLTVVRQSIAAGNTNGLQWFLPYSWPSIMLAIEYLAWGFFFALACFILAPAFRGNTFEKTIFWTLIITGILSLLALIGQVVGSNNTGINPLTLAGVIGWGPGLTITVALITIWFRRNYYQN